MSEDIVNDVAMTKESAHTLLEEQCRRKMESVVNMRVRYVEHLRKEDKKRANREIAILNNEIRRKITLEREKVLDSSTRLLLEKTPATLLTSNISEQKELLNHIETLDCILKQIRNDSKGALLRLPILGPLKEKA